jgi:hypothetical protein
VRAFLISLSRRPAHGDGWRRRVVDAHRAFGHVFEFDILFYVWPVLLGAGMVIGAFIGSWSFGWGVFGAALASFAALSLAARIRYGTYRVRDVWRLVAVRRRSSR